MKFVMVVIRECPCCGEMVFVNLPYDTDVETQELVASDCECGCTLDMATVRLEKAD